MEILHLAAPCRNVPVTSTLDIMSHPRLVLRATPRSAYGENDNLEVMVELRGADLSGSTSLYDDHRQLTWLEEALRGFPRQVGDKVSFSLGIFAQLDLHLTTDAKGRATVEASLATPVTVQSNEKLTIPFLADPAALDAFCDALRSFHPGVECEAALNGRQWE